MRGCFLFFFVKSHTNNRLTVPVHQKNISFEWKPGTRNVSALIISYNNNTSKLTAPLGSVKQTGPEVPPSFPRKHTTSHLLTGARTCK